MRIQALTRHAGVSFNGGPGFVHLRAANADPRVLRSAWESVVVQSGLGGPLRLRERGGEIEGSAPVFPFFPLASLSAALRATYAGRSLSRSLADELAIAGIDARMYDASYGMHVQAAGRRGWPVQSLILGFYPAVLVGAGRHARLLVMNMPAHVSSALALAGVNKAIARDLLASHGLPVAPGELASSPDAARRVAQRLGGGPVVIKRLIGGNSDGVIVGVSNARDVTSAAKQLLATGHAVLVESLVTGTELRLHFISGRLHRAFRAEPRTVTGDGRRSLAALIEAEHPRYLAVMSAASAHRRRLVMSLWGLGVRTLADMARTVPARGRVVRISAATGAGMERVEAKDFIPSRDLGRLERFLAQHGSPSCGMDVIVRTAGAPFDQAGAILELNVPCGFGYLDDPRRAIAADLEAAIAGDPTFRRDKGRIPVWLVMEADAKRLARPAEAALRKRHGRVAVGRLEVERSNWVSLVNQTDVDALVVIVSEAAILAHGIPVNLAPMLLPDSDRATFPRRYPATYRTVKHAKGRLGSGRLP